jgi:hypothetical protein
MVATLLLGILLAGAPARLRACDPKAVPRFEDFAVPRERITSPRLDLKSHPIGRRFRTILRRAVREEPPNLAGHYLVVEWGCGTACSQFAIVNLKSGSIWHNDKMILTRGLKTLPTSRLVMLNPGAGSFAEVVPNSFHLWQDDKLTALCSLEPRRNQELGGGGSSYPSLRRTTHPSIRLGVAARQVPARQRRRPDQGLRATSGGGRSRGP